MLFYQKTVPFSCLSGRKNINQSLDTELVNTSQTEERDRVLQICLLNMNEFLRWLLEEDTTSSQQVMAVVNKETKSRKRQKFATASSATDPFLEQGSGIGTGPSSSKAVHGRTKPVQPVMRVGLSGYLHCFATLALCHTS